MTLRLLTALLIALTTACAPRPEPAPTPPRSPVEGGLEADVQLNKERYAPGETVEVTVIAVGLSDRARVTLGDTEIATSGGSLSLVAPRQPGSYEVRLLDGERQLAVRAFSVQEASSSPRDPPGSK